MSTRTLAARAGVVHYHFASVQALLREAAVASVRALLDELGDLLDRAETPADALDLILRGVERFTGRDATSLLFVETYLAATRDEALRAAIADQMRVFRGRLARLLAKHRVAAPDETAAVLTAAIDGFGLHRALDPTLGELTVAPVLSRTLVRAAE